MDSSYQLRFPCPECNRPLTLKTTHGVGQCPLCHCSIEAELSITIKPKIPRNTSKLGWDRRAFKRTASTNKPAWQPIPAE